MGIAVGVLALAPPANGAMLLVPLGPGSAPRLVERAVSAGAGLLRIGPITGSLIVQGRRDKIRAALRGSNVMMLSAPAAACGSQPPGGTA